MDNLNLSDEENVETDAHFIPIVNLPLVENLLEDEEIILEKGVKAYLYDTKIVPNEWKERGVGELKILKDNENGRYRLLMRRNQVKKVCINHAILANFKLVNHTKKGNTLIWFAAQDWSDDAPESRSFAATFDKKEDANEFSNAINNIVQDLNQLKDNKTEKVTNEEDLLVKKEDKISLEETDNVCEDVKNLKLN